VVTLPRCLCLLLILWMAVSRPSTAIPAGSYKTSSWTAKDITNILAEVRTSRSLGDYQSVERLCREAARLTLARGDSSSAAKFLHCVGNTQFAGFQYRKALASYFDARKLAESAGDRQELGAILFNLSSLYQQLWDHPSALQAAEEGLAITEDLDQVDYQPELLLLLGRLQPPDQTGAAISYFRQGIEAARLRGAASAQARGLDLLGSRLLTQGDLSRADAAHNQAYRLRLAKSPAEIGFSLVYLSALRLAQASSSPSAADREIYLQEAEEFADRALELQADTRKPSFPHYVVRHQMGLIQSQQGNAAAALDDFRAAIHEAQSSRQHFLPAISSFEGANAGLEEGIFDSFVEAAAKQGLASGDPQLARESFLEAEINRAANLRQDIEMEDVWRLKLSPEYWGTLASLRTEEARLVVADKPRSAVSQRLELKLSEMEAQAGLDFSQESFENFDDFRSLKHILEGLRKTEVLLSFHLGEKESFLWAVTRNSLRLYPLASRNRIRQTVEEFRDAVQLGRPEAEGLGRQLYRELFGHLRDEEESKPAWLLSLEDALFELPFAALVPVPEHAGSKKGAGPMNKEAIYLVQRHSLQVVPGAFFLKQRPAGRSLTGRMVAVGDPVYNVADPRWHDSRDQPQMGFWGLEAFQIRPFASPQTGTGNGLQGQLNRLAGSGGETEAVSRSWGSAPITVLTGAEASRERLLQELASPAPDVIHLATHVLAGRLAQKSGSQKKSFIALGLGPDQMPELLSESDIGVLQVPDSLVVMTGCATATGDILAGAGLQGLTQAWAVAGARGVVATQWPVPDLSGDFLPLFYTALSSSSTAEALRQAQVAMIHSGTAYAASSAWASYQLFGGTR
jgi:CHAT domain-containing protein